MKQFYLFFVASAMMLLLSSTSQSQVQTLVLRPGPTDGKGAEMSDYTPNMNTGTCEWFDGNAWTVEGTPVTIRSLIEFDLTAISPMAEIISATLSLYCNPFSTHYQLQSGDNQSYLLRVTESWDDMQVTWNTQPEVSMENPVIIPTSTSTTQNYPDIDVTAHVADMVANPTKNFGWEIRLITEELYRSMQFSSHHDQEQYRPILTIKYSCPLPVANWGYVVDNNTCIFSDSSSSSVFQWQWNFGDGYLSNLPSPQHIYAEPGNYFVCLAVTDSCGVSTFCDSISVWPNAIPELYDGDVTLFPNPVADNLSLSVKMSEPAPIPVVITDVRGKVMYYEVIESRTAELKAGIDVSHFAAGIYFLNVSPGNKPVMKKFIIIR